MITSIQDLTRVQYWLTPNPGSLSDQTTLMFAGLFGLCIVLKILLRTMGRQYLVSLSRYHKQFVYRLEKMFLTMGILGLLWLFFAYEIIPFFSARFWFVIWIVSVLIWAYYIFYYVRFEIPASIQHDHDRKSARKYLPRKKSK